MWKVEEDNDIVKAELLNNMQYNYISLYKESKIVKEILSRWY